jgi:hypothetical protein
MGRPGGTFLIMLACASSVTRPVLAQVVELSPPAAGGHLEVALHARSMHASARAEQAAWLTVTLPLDRLAMPHVAQEVPAPAPPPPAAEPAPAVSAPLVSFEQLRALTKFSRRATVVALSVVGTAAERRRLDSLSTRARTSALLPELRLRAVRNTDQALRWVPTTDDPYRVTQADGAGLILEASASFRLDRLVFAHEELLVERLRLRAGAVRLKLEARVQAALLGLFRAHQLACADDPNDPAQAQEVVKALELFAELDNLTAGWFGEQAPSFSRAVWGFPEAVLGVCTPPDPAPARATTNPVASLDDSE